MEPIIGITCGHEYNPTDRFYVNRTYVRSIEMAGGIPLLIPGIKNKEHLSRIVEQVDGILLPGGYDVDPSFFGEEPIPGLGVVDPIWDEAEISVTQMALGRRIPILGICRGVQVLNVAAGGSLFQDIATQVKGNLTKHSQDAPRWYATHDVTIEPNTIVEKMLGTNQIRVNSFHHQAIKAVAPNFKVTAKARDGVIEAIESRVLDFAVGLQWHPEGMWDEYPVMKGIFKEFVKASGTPRVHRAD